MLNIIVEGDPKAIRHCGHPLVFILLMDESHGTAVTPQSLYEAQLEKRLGHLPPWIEALK